MQISFFLIFLLNSSSPSFFKTSIATPSSFLHSHSSHLKFLSNSPNFFLFLQFLHKSFNLHPKSNQKPSPFLLFHSRCTTFHSKFSLFLLKNPFFYLHSLPLPTTSPHLCPNSLDHFSLICLRLSLPWHQEENQDY